MLGQGVEVSLSERGSVDLYESSSLIDLGFEAHQVCPAGRAVRALPLPIPVAYGRKRKERDLRQSRRQKKQVSEQIGKLSANNSR